MATIVVSTNVTLDGVMQDPTGEEGTACGGWFNAMTDADWADWTARELAEAHAATALLLGRVSDEWFATRWSDRTGEWADRLNTMPKYVVTSEAPRWGNATALADIDAVADLRDELDGEIVVYASRMLVQALLERELVDELRLTVHPVVAGDGGRLFGERGASLRRVEARPIGERLTYVVYDVVRSQAAVAGSVPDQNHSGIGTP